jgi:hypothetical protein
MKLISRVEVHPLADLGGKNQAPAVTEMNPELVAIAHLSGIPHIRLVSTSVDKPQCGERGKFASSFGTSPTASRPSGPSIAMFMWMRADDRDAWTNS